MDSSSAERNYEQKRLIKSYYTNAPPLWGPYGYGDGNEPGIAYSKGDHTNGSGISKNSKNENQPSYSYELELRYWFPIEYFIGLELNEIKYLFEEARKRIILSKLVGGHMDSTLLYFTNGLEWLANQHTAPVPNENSNP